MRYLGGGIGHLEQFPPAHSNDEGMAHNDDGVEVEMDNFIRDGDPIDYSSSSEGGKDSEGSRGDGGESAEETEDMSDDALDEDMGNMY